MILVFLRVGLLGRILYKSKSSNDSGFQTVTLKSSIITRIQGFKYICKAYKDTLIVQSTVFLVTTLLESINFNKYL